MNLFEQEPALSSDDTRLIPLTQGQFAKVDACDYERISAFKWFAHWSKTSRSFYAVRSIYLGGGKEKPGVRQEAMARVIEGLAFGDPRQVDHENHDTLDNTRGNLRVCSRPQQMQNRRKFSSQTSSKYKGVYRKKWRSQWRWASVIQFQKKRILIGYFVEEEDARDAYIAKARELHGVFAHIEGKHG
jgi:hypothetical protein